MIQVAELRRRHRGGEHDECRDEAEAHGLQHKFLRRTQGTINAGVRLTRIGGRSRRLWRVLQSEPMSSSWLNRLLSEASHRRQQARGGARASIVPFRGAFPYLASPESYFSPL